jgi:hypothetical protein
MIGLGFGNFQSGEGGFDPDAQAFITAAGITGVTQQEGLNNYVLALKSSGVWDRLDAIYPMCPIDGSIATQDSSKYNLKDPRDLDAAFRITWNNSLTVTVNGVQGNGTNQRGDTHYNVNTNAILNDHCLGFVGNIGGNNMGASIAGNNPYNSFLSSSYWGVNSSYVNIASSFSNGFVLQQRTASNAMAIYDDSSTPSATSTLASSSTPNLNYFILARNLNGTPSGFSNTLYNHFFFGKSLTTQQISDFISAINTFNSTVR